MIRYLCLGLCFSFLACSEHDKHTFRYDSEALELYWTELEHIEQIIKLSPRADRDSLRILYNAAFEKIHQVSIDSVKLDLKQLRFDEERFQSIADSIQKKIKVVLE